jgi:[ribosomal protein S5]-alanine N-acetyltransferase
MSSKADSSVTRAATFPTVLGPRLLIRPYVPADAASLAQAADDPRIAIYMRDAFPSPYTLRDAEGWISLCLAEAAPGRNFALCLRDGTFAGGIGLRPGADIERGTFELGYWIAPARWGGGLATEAVATFGVWAFARYPGLRRLEAAVFHPNAASVRVLEKAGYRYEGTRRSAAVKHGQVINLMMYSLLREECLAEASDGNGDAIQIGEITSS